MKSTRTIRFVSLLTTCLTLVFAAALIWTPAAQAVTKTVCNTGTPDFATLAAAVTDANTNFPTGGVTYDVCAGFTETAPAGGYVINSSGSAGNEIIFQKSGAGTNPTITASAALTVGSLTDGLFKLIGADCVTITGFTMQENPANTVTTAAPATT